ncbi:MAG TPA: hypothetical protein VI670_04030 [Thermoanaerobaculia bacterium]|jgi:hypothetical protein
MSDSDEVRNLFLDCVNLARKDISAEATAAIEASRADIEQLLAALATLIARRDRTKRWFTRVDAPGYLLRQVENVEIRVPLHLFDDVPPDDVVDELLRLAAAMRTEGGVICLSGSCAVYSALHAVADCDFCEYLRGNTADVVRLATQAAVDLASADLVPLKVTGWGDKSWILLRPWPKPAVTDDLAGTTRTIMAHYFGRTNFAGDVAVTKLMIPLGKDGEDARASSFPAQELPLASTERWVPRCLFEPREIAAYAVFLHGQIQKYKTSNVAKALKRAFSLARVLFLAEEANAIAALFGSSDLLVRAVTQSRAEYAQRLAAQYGEVPDDVRERALASAVEFFRRCAGNDIAAPATAEAILTALAALPDSGAATAGTLLERFVRSVDAMLPVALH